MIMINNVNTLQEKAHLFYSVATTFGLSDFKDSKGRPLYLYGVDVDTKQAYDALNDFRENLKSNKSDLPICFSNDGLRIYVAIYK